MQKLYVVKKVLKSKVEDILREDKEMDVDTFIQREVEISHLLWGESNIANFVKELSYFDVET